MLDIKLIRERPEYVEKALARRHGDYSLKPLLAVDEEFRKVNTEWESLNRRSNEISEQFKTGQTPKEQMEALRAESKDIKKRLSEVDPLRKELEQKLEELLLA